MGYFSLINMRAEKIPRTANCPKNLHVKNEVILWPLTSSKIIVLVAQPFSTDGGPPKNRLLKSGLPCAKMQEQRVLCLFLSQMSFSGDSRLTFKSCYPSVKMGWATKTIIFEDDRGHKTTSFFTCKFFGQFVVH